MIKLKVVTRVAVCLGVTLALCGGLHTASAQARVSSPQPAVVASPQPGVLASPQLAAVAFPQLALGAPSSLSVPNLVCSLAKFPVTKAAVKLIALMAKRNIAVLSASLLTTVGKPWCEKGLSSLKPVFKQTVAKKPALRSRIGPFAFNVFASTVGRNQSYAQATVSWTEFDLTSRLRYFYVWGRVNGGAWIRIQKTVSIRRGNNVQFAVRIDNVNGISSPFSYSRVYYVN
jgi:hypothetical protein